MKVSVITVHLNDFSGLLSTLDSVRNALRDENLRWVVVDGDSAFEDPDDQSVFDDIRALGATLKSESDQGIYDAMNKGTAYCDGDYILYLNAGDQLHPDFSRSRLECELGMDKPAMIWGTCYERFPGGELVRLKNRSPGLAWYGTPVNHQNVLFRRDVLGSKPYDTRYQYCADYDLISRILKSGGSVHRTELPIAIFQRGGASAQNFAATMQEEELLRTEHYGLPRVVSKAITALKKANHRVGSKPAVRRLLRKWV
jgi:putative colanic acid biosynthesis glycosyltransferase